MLISFQALELDDSRFTSMLSSDTNGCPAPYMSIHFYLVVYGMLYLRYNLFVQQYSLVNKIGPAHRRDMYF